jgi:hypothetical protein
LGGARPLAEVVTGRVAFDVGKGRIRGMSLLRGTMERLGTAGQVALALGQAKGGSTLQHFYEDEFESIHGTWKLGKGVARTRDLKLRYRHYDVDLKGSIGLLDRRLNFTGTLTIGEEVDATIAGSEGAARQGEKRVIPLASVTGTLNNPRVDLTREAIVAFATTYTIEGHKSQELKEEIDEVLGEGAGEEVMDLLEGLLGRGLSR